MARCSARLHNIPHVAHACRIFASVCRCYRYCVMDLTRSVSADAVWLTARLPHVRLPTASPRAKQPPTPSTSWYHINYAVATPPLFTCTAAARRSLPSPAILPISSGRLPPVYHLPARLNSNRLARAHATCLLLVCGPALYDARLFFFACLP